MTGPVLTMALLAFPVAPGSMPTVDQDVLIWTAADAAAQLGAYLGEYDEGPQIWVNAHGEAIAAPVAWAEMPVLPVLPVLSGRG